MSLPSILARILACKRDEVEEAKRGRPLETLASAIAAASPTRDLARALRRADGQPVRVIAEIKRASPSKGVLRDPFEPAAIAADYAANGATCLLNGWIWPPLGN